MTFSDNAQETTAHKIEKLPRFSLLKEILIWHAAWQENHRIQHLSKDALRDMGLTDADRASISIRQIASRMRG